MNITIQDLQNVPHVAFYNFESLDIKRFTGISTDSRSVKSGELFFAIRGEKFDGNNFVISAFSKGASCAVVDAKADRSQLMEKPLFVVNDTTRALGYLANIYRNKFDIPVIAIAGSNGKTTVKEMIAAVLSTQYSVLSTEGNLNNHIGVPQTLFRLTRKHNIAVIEVGTNHFGELQYLCEILNPTHGLITNLGREHLQFFKTLKGVAKAEGELFNSPARPRVGFINSDDALVVAQTKKLKRKINYGFEANSSQFRGKLLKVNENGCSEFSIISRKEKEFVIQLSIPGTHAMMNGLAAAAVGLSFDVSKKNIQRSLKNFVGVEKRMEVIKVGTVTILNDTYNSNPDSVASALETLKSMECKGNRIIILADMLELGNTAKKEHECIGRMIDKMGFEYLLTYGEMARNINETANVKIKIHYDQKNTLAEYAAELLSDGDVVLVKGSRGMKMENVVTFLVERLGKRSDRG